MADELMYIPKNPGRVEWSIAFTMKFENVSQLDQELNTAGMTLRYNARDGYAVIPGSWGTSAPVMPHPRAPISFKTKEELLHWGNTAF